jgi:hypothetical protein
VQCVAPVDQHENRLQQVVAIVPAPGDVQKEIQFGGGWNVVKGQHRERRQGGVRVQQYAQHGGWWWLGACGTQASFVQLLQVCLPTASQGGYS